MDTTGNKALGLLVRGRFDSGDFAMFTGYGTVTDGGVTYYGAGALLSIGDAAVDSGSGKSGVSFAAAWKDLKRNGRAGCPFTFSTSLCLWNNGLLSAGFPGLKGKIPERLFEFHLKHGNASGSDVPLVFCYIFVPFLLMQLASAEALNYDRKNGLRGFEKPEVAEFLKYNRKIFCEAAIQNGGQPVTDIKGAMNLFLSGHEGDDRRAVGVGLLEGLAFLREGP